MYTTAIDTEMSMISAVTCVRMRAPSADLRRTGDRTWDCNPKLKGEKSPNKFFLSLKRNNMLVTNMSNKKKVTTCNESPPDSFTRSYSPIRGHVIDKM